LSVNEEGIGSIDIFPPAIPDSEIDYDNHYAAREIEDDFNDGDTVDTWIDLAGEDNLSAFHNSPTFENDIINGHPAVRYNDDGHEVSFDTQSQPNVALTVLLPVDASSDQWVWTGSATDSDHQLLIGFDFDGYNLQNHMGDVSATTDPALLTQIFDGDDSVIRLNGGEEETSGSVSSEDLNGLTLGARGSTIDSDVYDGYIAEHGVIYQRLSYSDIESEEDRLMNIYDIGD